MTTTLDPAGTVFTLETGETLTVYQILVPGTGGSFVQQTGSSISWEDVPGAGFYPPVPPILVGADSTIDLGGADLNLGTDAILNTYKVGNGNVNGGAGSAIIFQDYVGAGFDPSSTSFNGVVNGIDVKRSSVRSRSLSPVNRWTMPNPAANLDANYTDFRGYVLSFVQGSGWAFNQCTFEQIMATSSPYSFWLYWLNQVAYIEIWTGAIDGNGFKTYGPPSVIACRINSSAAQQLDADGNIMTLPTSILVSETTAASRDDRITLPDGTVHLVTKVKDTPGPNGAMVFKEIDLL